MTDFLEYLQQIRQRIVTISAAEAIERHIGEEFCFVDLRDGFELAQYGQIPRARHCPRGSLEFRIPVNSPYHEDYFSAQTSFIFYCSHGARSILATYTAQETGLANVCHIEGGMIAWVRAGGAIERVRKQYEDVSK